MAVEHVVMVLHLYQLFRSFTCSSVIFLNSMSFCILSFHLFVGLPLFLFTRTDNSATFPRQWSFSLIWIWLKLCLHHSSCSFSFSLLIAHFSVIPLSPLTNTLQLCFREWSFVLNKEHQPFLEIAYTYAVCFRVIICLPLALPLLLSLLLFSLPLPLSSRSSFRTPLAYFSAALILVSFHAKILFVSHSLSFCLLGFFASTIRQLKTNIDPSIYLHYLGKVPNRKLPLGLQTDSLRSVTTNTIFYSDLKI